MGVAVELILWTAIFNVAGTTQIGGFDKEMYLAYVVWAPFLGRVGISWMYESMMVGDVSSGSLNIVLTRPISFYEYYLSQLMGYKVLTTLISLLIPLILTLSYNLPIHYERLPLAFLLVFAYLFLIHNLSFIVSTFAFFLTRVGSFTLVKNLSMWLLAGELIPIDLMPNTLSQILLYLPFSSGVYIPVSYITGRCQISLVQQGFISILVAFLISSVVARLLWQRGLKGYTGTGA